MAANPRNAPLKYLLRVCAAAGALSAILSGAASAQPPCRTAVEEPEFSFAAGCMIRHGDRMLVVRHRYGGRLGFPGGHSNLGENGQCAAHRETWEETGVDVIVQDLLKRFGNGFALYRCALSDSAPVAASELEVPPSGTNEISQVLWIDPRSTSASEWRFPRQYPVILRVFDHHR